MATMTAVVRQLVRAIAYFVSLIIKFSLFIGREECRHRQDTTPSLFYNYLKIYAAPPPVDTNSQSAAFGINFVVDGR